MKISLYDYEVTVPKEWNIVIDKKATYRTGMLALKPTVDPHETCDLIWEDLTKRKETHPTIEAFMEGYFDTMKKNNDVKSFEVTKGDVMRRGAHTFYPHEFTYEFKRYMRKGFAQKIIGMSMYDLSSNRFAILYTKIDLPKGSTIEKELRDVVGSLNCVCSDEQPPPG